MAAFFLGLVAHITFITEIREHVREIFPPGNEKFVDPGE